MPVTTTEPVAHKTAELVQRLRDQIVKGGLKPGSRLPTQRELCQQYGVGESTALAAMTRLVGEGLITRHRGQGSFVSEIAAAAPSKVIDFIRASTGQSVERAAELMWIESFSHTAADCGFRADWHHLRPEQVQDVVALAKSFADSEGAVVWLKSNLGPQFVAQLHQLGVPVVALWMRMRLAMTDPPEPAPYPQVAFSRRRMAYLATEHLAKVGRKAIAFCGGTSGPWIEGFLEAVRDLELPVPASWIVPGDALNISSVHRGIHGLIRQKHRPQAIVFLSDYLASAAQLLLLAEGVRVPDDIAVMACCDGPSAEQAPLPISAVAVDRQMLCQAPLDLLHGRGVPTALPGGLLPPIMLPLHLMIRESCGGRAQAAPERAPMVASDLDG